MKVHITIAEDAGAAPGAGPERQLSVARDASGAVDAGPAAAAGTGQAMPAASSAAGAESARPAGADSVTDGGEAPAWLTELVRLADAGEVARPGEEPQDAHRPSEGPAMDAGSAGAAPR